MKILTDTGLLAFWNKIKQLVLGNRPYEPTEFSGKGYKVLEKNIQTVDGVKKNILTAVMLNQSNTIYEIRYDFDLDGATINIPDGCTLKFEGGSLANGTLDGDFIIADCNYHIFKNIDFVPNSVTLHNDFLRPEWFGAKGDFKYKKKFAYDYVDGIGTDDSDAFTYCIAMSAKVRVCKIKLQAVTYYISKGIKIHDVHLEMIGEYASKNAFRATTLTNAGGEHRNPFVNHDVTSCLFSNDCDNMITICDDTTATNAIKPGYPITFKNIVFNNYSKNNKTAIGINFASNNGSPLWPFIVTNCYFKGFDKAIYFGNTEDEAKYLVFKVYITFNSFYQNNWCVYFKNIANHELDGTPDTRHNNTWEFHFNDNCADNNTNILSVEVWRGVCEVSRNNMENSEEYLAVDAWESTENRRASTTKRQSYINLLYGASLIYTDNYCENLHIAALKVNILGDSYLDVRNNCFYSPRKSNNIEADVAKIDLSPILVSYSTLHIDRWDDKMRMDITNLTSDHSMDILNNCAFFPKINIFGLGAITVFTDVITNKIPDYTCLRKVTVVPGANKELIKNNGYAYVIEQSSYLSKGLCIQSIEGKISESVWNEGVNQSDVVFPVGKITEHSKDYRYSYNIYRGNMKSIRLYAKSVSAKSISCAIYDNLDENIAVNIQDCLSLFDCDKVEFGSTVNATPTSLNS